MIILKLYIMESIDTTTTTAAQPTTSGSTAPLLGFELAKLMPFVNDNPTNEAEDQAYITAALELLKQAKDLKKAEDYAGALKSVNKAVQRIGELISLRVEKGYNDYKVLEAPFLFQQGSILLSYIEEKADVFGNIPELNIEQSDDSEGEEESAEEAGEEAPPATEGEKS